MTVVIGTIAIPLILMVHFAVLDGAGILEATPNPGLAKQPSGLRDESTFVVCRRIDIDASQTHLCIVVFDILLHDDAHLTKMELWQRQEKLAQVFRFGCRVRIRGFSVWG